MKADVDVLEITKALWPIFVSICSLIVGALGWLFYQLNKKVSKDDCKEYRYSCREQQDKDNAKLENSIRELRDDIKQQTSLLLELFRTKKDRDD